MPGHELAGVVHAVGANVIAIDIADDKLAPQQLVGQTISLEQSIDALMNMDQFQGIGATVVTSF